MADSVPHVITREINKGRKRINLISMGVYAETHFEINCKSAKTAKKVLETLKNKEVDENGNTFGSDLEIVGKSVCGYEDSGRIQNLEYRCEQIWEAIKDIEGVIDMEAPFLEEADGMYFEVGVD